MSSISGFRFQVTGKVQKARVFFRKCTAEKATELGLRGHVKNEADGSVTGVAASIDSGALDQFKTWLSKTGSPQSEIKSASFTPLTLQEINKVPPDF
ncbi:putative acylphosphatase, partial [Catenaria anguillulae PL171]